MIKKLYVLIFTCSIISSSFYAMDKPDNPIKKTIDIADINEIEFLGNNELIISTRRDVQLITISSNKKDNLATLEEGEETKIRTNLEKTKAIIACPTRIILYDAITKESYAKNSDCTYKLSPFFTDPHIISIDQRHCQLQWNYRENTLKKHTTFKEIISRHSSIDSYEAAAYHAPKKQYTFATTNNEIYSYGNIEKDTCDKVNLKNMFQTAITHTQPLQIEHSPNGSFIAYRTYHQTTGNCDGVVSHLIDTHLKTSHFLCNTASNHSLAFHPSSTFLALYFPSKPEIQYIHTKTRKSITQNLLSHTRYGGIITGFSHYQRISFSADGNLLALVLPKQHDFSDKIIVIQVPFEVIAQKAYPLGTKEIMISLLMLLKKYQHNNQPLLSEIAQLLAQNTLAVSELTGD